MNRQCSRVHFYKYEFESESRTFSIKSEYPSVTEISICGLSKHEVRSNKKTR